MIAVPPLRPKSFDLSSNGRLTLQRLIDDLPIVKEDAASQFIESLGNPNFAKASASLVKDVFQHFNRLELVHGSASVLLNPVTFLKIEGERLLNPFFSRIDVFVLRIGESEFLYDIQGNMELMH